MKNTPMISVIMPAYNAEKYLEEAVLSVVNQTYTDWELLIIDDCSRDHTYAIMERLAQADTRIRIIQNEQNRGAAGTRNYGITLAKGEWIAFLDSDDRWDKTKLEKQMALIRSDAEIQFTFTGSAFVEDEGMSIAYELHVPDKVNRRKLLGRNIISCSSVLIRKELMMKHPMPDNRELHEDFATWLSILEEVPYAYGVNEPLLIYRRALASKSGRKSKSAVMNWNTYEEAGITGMLRILSMFSYTVHGLNKYARLRFYSYNQMMRKERLKKLFFFIMTMILVAAWTGIFASAWFKYYNHREVIRGVFVFWGHVALFTMYLFSNVVVGNTFSAFKVIYQTKHELVLSQFFTTLIVNMFTLVEIALIGRWSFTKLVKYAPYMWLVFFINFVISLLWSAMVRWAYAAIYPPHDLLLIHGDESVEYLEQMIQEQNKQYRINGRVSLQDDEESIRKEILKHEAVMLGAIPVEKRNEYIKFCYEHKKRCYCQTSLTDILIMEADRVFLSDIPLYLYKNCGMTLEQRILKRVMDIILSLAAIILLIPFYLVIGLIVRSKTKDSFIEKKRCLTKNGKIFDRIKFQTTDPNGDDIPGLSWIRRSHLDEIPQFFTVLKGDMSLVGPYPETEKIAQMNQEMIPEAVYRQEVKAGLTGYAQVYGKYTTSQINKLKMDVYYIHNYSFALDISIIAMTVKVLFGRTR